MKDGRSISTEIGVVITQLNNLHCTAEVLCDSIAYAPVDFDVETISNIFDLFSNDIEAAVEALRTIYEIIPANLYAEDFRRKENPNE